MGDAQIIAGTPIHPAGQALVVSAPLTLRDLKRLGEVVRDLPPESLEAWLACGRRIVAGMPTAEAEALMWRDLGGRPQ